MAGRLANSGLDRLLPELAARRPDGLPCVHSDLRAAAYAAVG